MELDASTKVIEGRMVAAKTIDPRDKKLSSWEKVPLCDAESPFESDLLPEQNLDFMCEQNHLIACVGAHKICLFSLCFD